jgi:hypothetical protein
MCGLKEDFFFCLPQTLMCGLKEDMCMFYSLVLVSFDDNHFVTGKSLVVFFS